MSFGWIKDTAHQWIRLSCNRKAFPVSDNKWLAFILSAGEVRQALFTLSHPVSIYSTVSKLQHETHEMFPQGVHSKEAFGHQNHVSRLLPCRKPI